MTRGDPEIEISPVEQEMDKRVVETFQSRITFAYLHKDPPMSKFLLACIDLTLRQPGDADDCFQGDTVQVDRAEDN